MWKSYTLTCTNITPIILVAHGWSQHICRSSNTSTCSLHLMLHFIMQPFRRPCHFYNYRGLHQRTQHCFCKIANNKTLYWFCFALWPYFPRRNLVFFEHKLVPHYRITYSSLLANPLLPPPILLSPAHWGAAVPPHALMHRAFIRAWSFLRNTHMLRSIERLGTKASKAVLDIIVSGI